MLLETGIMGTKVQATATKKKVQATATKKHRRIKRLRQKKLLDPPKKNEKKTHKKKKIAIETSDAPSKKVTICVHAVKFSDDSRSKSILIRAKCKANP